MLLFMLRRLLQLIPLALIISTLVFLMVMAIPGDPTFAILGPEASEAQREALREQLGLNDPLPIQYITWLSNALQGDLGRSLMTRESVTAIVLRNAAATIQLISLALVLTVLGGVILGVVSVMWRGKFWGEAARFLSNLGVAIPNYVVAVVLVLVMSVLLGWLPATGFINFFDNPVEFLRAAILPALALAAGGVAIISRQIRSSLLESLEDDYIKTARAKGLSRNKAILRHGLRNALLPALTIAGIIASNLIGGSIIIESIFAIPGLGQVLVNAILQRDILLLQGAILIVVAIVVVVNLIVDITYTIVDPRIRL